MTPEIKFYESRLGTIKAHYGLKNTGYDNRGQISQDASESDAATFSDLGVKHALELQDAWRLMRTEFPETFHLLDIGCGLAITPAVFKDESVKLRSYHGYDYSQAMLSIALKLNPELTFVDQFSKINKLGSPTLVLLNHVLGQNGVDDSVLKVWADNFHRVLPYEFHMLSIEILDFQPSNNRREIFQKLLNASKFSVDVVQRLKTPGQHSSLKDTQHWRISRV